MAQGCGFCGEPESVIHMLRNCSKASVIWIYLFSPELLSNFFGEDMKSWARSNLKLSRVKVERIEWRVIFGVACWIIWKERNRRIFRKEERERRVEEVCWLILSSSHNMCRVRFEANSSVQQTRIVELVCWSSLRREG